jgi:hypothetical protein
MADQKLLAEIATVSGRLDLLEQRMRRVNWLLLLALLIAVASLVVANTERWPWRTKAPSSNVRANPVPAVGSSPSATLYLTNGKAIDLLEGKALSAEDLGLERNSADHPYASVRTQRSKPEALELMNNSSDIWEAVIPNGSPKKIRPQEAVQLTQGTKIKFEQKSVAEVR